MCYCAANFTLDELALPDQELSNAKDGLPGRLTGPWVYDKNYYVQRYLSIFSRGIGRKWAGKIAYVDLFAGPGTSIVRESGEEFSGSPLLALECDFARYVFVDTPEVIAILKQRLSNHSKLSKIAFIEGDCNLTIDRVLTALPEGYLTLAFIDPTGLQVGFRTIERLVKDRRVDLLMTIQFGMGVLMNLRQYLSTEGQALSAFLGSTDWRNDASKAGTVSQLGAMILGRYMKQLAALGYETVQNLEIIRNEQKMLLYFIVLASRHPLGQRFWSEATRIGPSGQRRLL
jgi:three-Cys-motif partner protein